MNTIFKELPQFEVIQSQRIGMTMKCSGVIKNLTVPCRVKPGGIVVIYSHENQFIQGRLLEINPNTSQVSIEVSSLESQDHFIVGGKYPLLDGYWGGLAALVFNPFLTWKKVKFESHDSTIYRPDGTVEIVKGGWDHEHCRICSQKISRFETDNPFGYVNQNDDWLCEACYQKYVLKKSLGFINMDEVL